MRDYRAGFLQGEFPIACFRAACPDYVRQSQVSSIDVTLDRNFTMVDDIDMANCRWQTRLQS
jgi:hypothetical protein